MVAVPETKCSPEVVAEKDIKKLKPTVDESKKSDVVTESIKSIDSEPAGSRDAAADGDNSDKLEKAADKLSAGKKALLQNLPQKAVDYLADACALVSAVHGDMSLHMCEYYYQYGRALLELARIEEDVLGNALTGVPEGDDLENSQVENPEKLTEEERETVAQQVDEALEENYNTVEGIKKTEEKDGKSADDGEEAMNGDKKNKGEDKEDEAKKGSSDKDDKKLEEKSAEKKMETKEVKAGEDKKEKKDLEEEKRETKEVDKVEKMDEDKVVSKENGKSDEKAAEPESEEALTKNGKDTAVNGSGSASTAQEEEKKEGEESSDKEGDDEEEEEAMEEGEDAAEGEEETAQEETPEGEDTQEAEEDVASLQIAWEVLELARTIYDRKEKLTDEETLKMSQVYLKLGEVCLENENYPESINMYTECLKRQESILEADDRWLAETHYQLGLAHSLADNFDESVKHLDAAITVIQTRITNVKEKLAKDKIEVKEDLDASSLSSEQQTWVADVRELQKLLPELQEKMVDIKDTKANFTEKLKAMKDVTTAHFSGQLSGGSSGKSAFEDGASSSACPATDTNKDAKPISTTLIRKKRKPEEEAASAEDGTKKPRTEILEEKKCDDKKEEEMKDAEAAKKEKEAVKDSNEKKTKDEATDKDESKMDVEASESKKSES